MSDIERWLEQNGLGKYAELFIDNEIDFDVLDEISSDELEKLGIPLGARKRILRAISARAAEGRAASEVHAPPPPRAPSGEAERRQLSVMFCDLVGSTSLSSSMDAEDYRDLLAAYQAAISKVVADHQGYVARFMGDGLLIYFGYPTAQETDPERAVRAGLAIVDAIRGLQRSLHVRVGIATGTVVVGDIIGEGASEEAAVLGETPNLAARLQQAAAPDTVLLSPTTNALLEEHVETQPLEPVLLQGLSEPLIPYRAIRARSVSEIRETSSDVPLLVGRAVEVQLLLDRWSKATRGEGQVVLVSAEPGVGKSRLLQGFREQLPRTTKLMRLYCSPYHAGSALYPVIDAIQRTLDARCQRSTRDPYRELSAWVEELGLTEGSAVPLIAPLLSLAAPETVAALPPGTAESNRRTLDVLAAMIAAETAVAPVLLTAEDLHWADPTTLEFLDRVIAASNQQALLTVLTYRPEFSPSWAGQSHVTALALSHLTRDESRDLLRSMDQPPRLSDSAVDAIVERADGIPLYLEELARSAIESGRDEEGIPITLRDALTARVDRLGPAKEVAQLAAVIGREFSRPLLEALFTGTETRLSEAIDSLIASGLVHRQRQLNAESFQFKHALVRDAAYESLLKRRARTLHRRLLEHIEETSSDVVERPYELMAHHALAAREWEKAFDYADRAGVRAAARGANFEAIAQFDHALEAAAHMRGSETLNRAVLALRCELRGPLHAVGHTERLEGELKKGLADAERLEDAYHRTRLRTYLSNVYRQRGLIQDALATAHQAFADACAMGDRALVISSAFDLTQAERVAGHLVDSVSSAGRGLELIAPDEVGQSFGRPAPAHVLLQHVRAWSLSELGELEAGRELALEAVTLADELAHPFARVASRFALARSEYLCGDLPAARAELEAAIEVVRRDHLWLWMIQVGILLAEIDVRLGLTAEALSVVEEAMVANRTLGYRLWDGALHTVRGYALHGAGSESEARQELEEGIRLADRTDACFGAWCGWIAADAFSDESRATRCIELSARMAAQFEMRPLQALCAMYASGAGGTEALEGLRSLGMGGWAARFRLRRSAFGPLGQEASWKSD